MKRKYTKGLSIFLALVITLGSILVGVPNIAWAEGETFVETFDNLDNTGTSYIAGNFVGVNNITWTYSGGRGLLTDSGNDYSIDGKGLMFRRPADNPFINATIDGGIKDFSVDTKKAFTGSKKREIELLINDESKGTYVLDNNNADVQTFVVNGINVEGEFKLEIKFIGEASGAQTTIDNITWTSFGGGTTEPPTKVAPVTATPNPGAVEVDTTVVLSTSTDDAIIHYTTDGVDPTEDSTIYTDPIEITEALTIKAIAIKDSMEDSDISSFEYTIKAPVTLESIATAKVKANGTEVTVEGIVTGIIGNNVFIQDDTAGIYLYNGPTKLTELVVGNKIRLTGILDEFNNLKQMKNVLIEELISTGNSLSPEILDLDKINEEYESKLVKIENLKITSVPENLDSNYSIKATDGTKSIDLRVDTFVDPKIPSSNFKMGDTVTVTANVGQFRTSYQLMIRSVEDIEKIFIGEDTTAPIITHTPIAEIHITKDLEIKATVTDDRTVEYIKLYHRVKDTLEYTVSDMVKVGDTYSKTILSADLNKLGMEYYIEASDGKNISTNPEAQEIPYEVLVLETDITPPMFIKIEPEDGEVLDKTNTKPSIKAEYSDPSNINIESVVVMVDGVDVTTKATVTETSVTYEPITDLELGKHTVIIKVKDTVGNEAIKTWSFTIGEAEYNFYFGQLHSHTNLSDGQGTPDEAYSWARDRGNADFFAVTDHSNWLDNDTGSENITEVSQSTSTKWKTLNAKADEYDKDGQYAAIAGYEMTWSGSTGGWGHMNTFNTPWFASRTNKAMGLKEYYAKISEWPESINQLNHPGKTFGDFGDFGFYSEGADKVVQLIEVGNGEGPIRGSGYFPSYEYYTRALDKGWHLAPSNNQDNHKGNWVTSNDARNVVIADSLSRESIYDGIREMRSYATENKNLEIMYQVNGQIMGSQLSSPDKLNFSIQVNEPDLDDSTQKISKIDIISNGGVIAATKTFDDHNVGWNFELDPRYDYYYARVTQANKDISVTAPIWVGEVLPIGLAGLDVSSDYFEIGSSIDLNATIYNNGTSILPSAKVEFYVDSISSENKIGEDTIENIGQGATAKATIKWAAEALGEYNLYAVATIAGSDKQFTTSTKVVVVPQGSAIKVMVDFAHKNHYVSGGDYADKIESLKEMLKSKNMIMVENHKEITIEMLNDIDILIITSPQPIDRGEVLKSKLSDDEVQAVKHFTDGGGSLILTSRANYSDGKGEYQNSIQGNKVLDAIGSNIIFNSDQVVDPVTNGGQEYRLYLDTYPTSKYNLNKGLAVGDLYSFYSGCSVLLKDGGNNENVDFLVKGHSTTKNNNAGNVTIGHIPTEAGNVHLLAAEYLSSGGKIVASGTTFFSDFEMSGDNRYTNIQIAENILEWLKPAASVEVKTIKEVRDGMPGNFGEKFTIEGRITAMSEAYSKEKNLNNAFFEVIYVQDETGGMTVFGVSNTKLPLGTKVKITGVAGQYEGDYQLQIKNEVEDLTVIDAPILEVAAKPVSTLDSMKKENEGWLVKVEGIVTRIDIADNSLYIKDSSEAEARVYVNGYIGDGTGDETKLGKWDPNIKVGDRVSAIGLVSKDPVGPRLRVRNTAEIVKEVTVADDYPIAIGDVEEIVAEDKLTVKVNVTNHEKDNMSGTIIIKLFDNNGRAYKVVYKAKSLTEGLNTVEFNLNPSNYPKGIKEIKVYIWDSLDNMKPLAQAK